MSQFKVKFRNNNAVSGRIISTKAHVSKFVTRGTKQFIQWFVLEAENEQQAIKIANKIVRQIWGEILGLR